MDRTETIGLIENVLQGLWPDWNPKEAETEVWLGEMRRFDYDVAKTAAQQYFADAGGSYKRPRLSGIKTKAQVIIQNRNVGRSNAKEPVTTNVFIECLEPPERNPNLQGKRKAVYAATDALQCDPDHVLRCAETMRESFERLYGGKWITVQTKPPKDNGLRGEQARQKAFRDILSGPDTKTKQWLKEYLERKTSKPKKQETKREPVLIGTLVGDEIPF